MIEVEYFGLDLDLPSLVMNDMNSLTHSCIHSFASFAIFALSGNAVFIIRATVARLSIKASGDARTFLFGGCVGEEEEEDETPGSEDMTNKHSTWVSEHGCRVAFAFKSWPDLF